MLCDEVTGIMIMSVQVGENVIFVDTHGVEHEALVTMVHGTAQRYTNDAGEEYWWEPCINCVIVSGDENKKDPYGRQLERSSSVTFWKNSTAYGYVYKNK